MDGSGTISGTGSVFDLNDEGGVEQDQTFDASTVTASPDYYGRVAFVLNPSVASGVPQIQFVGYTVDGNIVALVETTDDFGGTMGGTALAQGANTGAFGKSNLSGSPL